MTATNLLELALISAASFGAIMLFTGKPGMGLLLLGGSAGVVFLTVNQIAKSME